MTVQQTRPASVLVMTVFVIAMISAVVIGMLEINTEEIQLMQNHILAAQAFATAEAGLNDAMAHLRMDHRWNAGFVDKPFSGGVYSVTVDGDTILATGITDRGYATALEADVAVSHDGPPFAVEIGRLRVNR